MKIIAAADKGKQMHEIRVFRNPPVDNNLLIQIYWNSENVESQGSSTGLCLADILKELGLDFPFRLARETVLLPESIMKSRPVLEISVESALPGKKRKWNQEKSWDASL